MDNYIIIKGVKYILEPAVKELVDRLFAKCIISQITTPFQVGDKVCSTVSPLVGTIFKIYNSYTHLIEEANKKGVYDVLDQIEKYEPKLLDFQKNDFHNWYIVKLIPEGYTILPESHIVLYDNVIYTDNESLDYFDEPTDFSDSAEAISDKL